MNRPLNGGFQQSGDEPLTRNDARVTFTATGSSAAVGRISLAPMRLMTMPRRTYWWEPLVIWLAGGIAGFMVAAVVLAGWR